MRKMTRRKRGTWVIGGAEIEMKEAGGNNGEDLWFRLCGIQKSKKRAN